MPAEDVPTAGIEPMDEVTSEALSRTMFVADFATQFAHWLGVRPVGYRELAAAIEAPGTGAIREPLWELYEGLMRFLLNVCACPQPMCQCPTLQLCVCGLCSTGVSYMGLPLHELPGTPVLL